MRLGFEFPNQPRDLTADEWAKVDALHSQACKVRPYNLTPANLAGIRDRGLTVLLRPNSDGDVDVQGRVWELSRAAWTLRERGIGDIWIIPDNEPNLHNRPVPPDYWQRLSQVVVGLWYGHFGTRALAATVSYLNPPLAVGQGEEAWFEAAGSVLSAADGQCIHAYGQLDTGLIGRTLMLAKQYASGIPLIADEVGDSHDTAGWDLRGEALRVYLQLLRQSGVRIAILFILGGTDDWRRFVPPIDVVRQLAAVVPQEVPMPSKPTSLNLDPIAPVRPGEAIRVRGTIAGIDGPYGALEIFAHYPQRDENTQWGQSGKAVFVSQDGSFDHAVALGPANASFTEPLTGTLEIRSLELDPQALAHGGSWGEQPLFTFPFTILPTGSVSSPPSETPNQEPVALPPAYDIMWERAGDVVNAATAIGDEELAERGRDIHRTIVRRKEGR